MATVDDVKQRLSAAGLTFEERELSANQVQLVCNEHDAVVNIWLSTGTVQAQGRDQAALTEALGDLIGKGKRSRQTPRAAQPAAAPPAPVVKQVFVVYGHDTSARTEVDAMLRRWGLEPLILDQLPSQGNTIIEKLEHYQQGVEWAVVLLTPDDLGYPALDPSKSAPRPRQNVVLEMGMLLSQLGRQKVAMIYKKSDPPMELPSDIQGYIYIPYETRADEVGQQLAKEMAAADFYHVPVEKI